MSTDTTSGFLATTYVQTFTHVRDTLLTPDQFRVTGASVGKVDFELAIQKEHTVRLIHTRCLPKAPLTEPNRPIEPPFHDSWRNSC